MSGLSRGLKCVPVLLALASLNLTAEDAGPPPTMVVAPFTGDRATIAFWRADMGLGLSQMLLESLENSALKFQVVETPVTSEPASPAPAPAAAPASEVLPTGKEKEAGKSAGDEAKKAAPAEVAGAGKTNSPVAPVAASAPISDFIFNADVVAFDTTTNSGKLGSFFSAKWMPNIGAGMVTAHIAIGWNIVDTSSHKIVKRGQAQASMSGPIFDFSNLAMPGAATGTTAVSPATASALMPTNGLTALAATAVTNKPAKKSFFSNFGQMLGSGLGGAKGGTNVAAAAPVAKAAPAASAAEAPSDGETYSYDNPAFIKSALGRASADAITNIVKELAGYQLPEPLKMRQATPGKVIAAPDNKTVIISLGSNQGFKAGDHLNLYEISYIKDSDGQIVFTNETGMGELVLSQVHEAISCCTYAGDSKVKEGWVVKE